MVSILGGLEKEASGRVDEGWVEGRRYIPNIYDVF